MHSHASRAPILDPLAFLETVRLRNKYIHCSGSSNGLVCFQTRVPYIFVVVNGAIRKSLSVSTVHRKVRENRASFCYIPSTGDYKIASFFFSEEQERGFFEVITLAVGGERIETRGGEHREIEVPSHLRHHFDSGVRLQTGTKTHSITPAITIRGTTAAQMEHSDRIATFDLEAETFTLHSVPISRFAAGYLRHKFVWDDRLCWASVVENKVMAYVWEDYERDEWRKEVVVLPISRDIGDGELAPVLFADNRLYLRVRGLVAAYDFRTGHLERTAHGLWLLHFLVPPQKRTLVSLDGMI